MKMNPQLQQTRHRILDSAPATADTATTTPNGNNNSNGEEEETNNNSNSNSNSNSMVKIMEKVCHEFVVDNYSSHIGIGVGVSIESSPFVVGGYTFTILLYPDGADRESHVYGKVSLFIKNHTHQTVRVVAALNDDPSEEYAYGVPLFRKSQVSYHQVVTVEPGQHYGHMHYVSHSYLMDHLRKRDSVIVKPNIAVVLDRNHYQPPPHPAKSISSSLCILFKVGDKCYYEQESVIKTRCPSLLSDYPQSLSNHIVVISDVDTHVFEAVLWFLRNKTLSRRDRKAIANSKDLFAVKMLAAADKFKLKDLTRQCESFVYYGDELLYLYYEIESDVKELWGNLSRLPQKMKELIPQKMKAA